MSEAPEVRSGQEPADDALESGARPPVRRRLAVAYIAGLLVLFFVVYFLLYLNREAGRHKTKTIEVELPLARQNQVGRAICAGCHEAEAKLCDYGPHRILECEICHGPGVLHSRGNTIGRAPLVMKDSGRCLYCHGTATEPTEFEKIIGSLLGPDPRLAVKSRIPSFEAHLDALEHEHRIRFDREKSGTQCVFCHDPHLLE